jgi:trimeric autotransporter adhesin
MKKLLYLLLALGSTFASQAQFITTNPSTTPVTVGADLNLSTGKFIQFNSIPSIKSFGTGNLSFGPYSGNTANTGLYNVSIGQSASQYTASGSNNVYIGASSGLEAGGGDNVGIGAGTLAKLGTGTGNSALGYYAGNQNSGNYNVFVGNNAGINNAGQGNVFVGDQAGTTNTTGLNNVFLGKSARSTNAGIIRGVAIGYNAVVTTDDGIVLGDATSGAVKVGVGTNAPAAKLHIVGGGTTATGVRFENLPTDAVGGAVMNYLVVDASGNIHKYLGAGPNVRQGVDEASKIGGNSFNDNWTLKNDFLYNKNKKGIIIGEGITSLPKGYGMYVTDGILTEKVKVAIKNSSDWADYVFNKDYKKMSLTEVEKYISINKHLPNIPSAAEMVSEGNDLAKTDAKLLAKIEELTLYMIDMKKENAQMKRQINSLKRKLNK